MISTTDQKREASSILKSSNRNNNDIEQVTFYNHIKRIKADLTMYQNICKRLNCTGILLNGNSIVAVIERKCK